MDYNTDKGKGGGYMEHDGDRGKQKKYVLAGIGFLAAAVLLLAAARKVPGFAVWYTEHIYPYCVMTVGRLCGIVPFSVAEAGLYILVIWIVSYTAVYWRNPMRIVSRVILLLGILLFSYAVNCGINYYSRPFADSLSYGQEEYSWKELEELCLYLTEKVNEYADYAGVRLESAEYGSMGPEAMQELGREYERLSGFYPRPKYLGIPWILSVQQLAGVYAPFTVEANYNNAMTAYNIPHTICHELSHLKGFMREDEANFIGFLACVGSGEPVFRYSGYTMGWIYAGNALASANMEAYQEIYEKLDGRVKADLQENNEFWERYEGRAAEAAEAVNDAYLKANSQEEGVESYGLVVDLMLGWFFQDVKEKE